MYFITIFKNGKLKRKNAVSSNLLVLTQIGQRATPLLDYAHVDTFCTKMMCAMDIWTHSTAQHPTPPPSGNRILLLVGRSPYREYKETQTRTITYLIPLVTVI